MTEAPNDLTRAEAEAILRAYRPEGPFASGRVLDVRLWATPIEVGVRVLLLGQRDGTPYVVEPDGAAEIAPPAAAGHPMRRPT